MEIHAIPTAAKGDDRTDAEPGRLRAVGEIVAVLLAFIAASIALGPLLGIPLAALALYGGVIVASLFLGRSNSSWGAIGLERPANWPSVLRVASAVTVLGLVVFYGLLVPALEATGLPPLDLEPLREAIAGNLSTYFLTMVLVVWGSAAFAEEILFRGFIFHRLERVFHGTRWPVGIAVAGQAVVFGLLHAYQGPVGILLTGGIGAVMAIAYLRTGRNLWAPILAHGLIDSIAVTGIYLGWI